MASNTINTGNTRRVLVSQSNVAMPGSGGAALGTYNAQRYSSFGGMVSGVGSLTLRVQFGVTSGTYLVSSAIAIYSGGMDFTMSNRGLYAGFAITAAASQSLNSILIYGAP